MHRDIDNQLDRQASSRTRCQGGGKEIPEARFGVWIEAFEYLSQAATTGAPFAELERLAAAELDELLNRKARDRWAR